MRDPIAPTVFSPLIETAIELSMQWHDATYRKSRWRDPAFAPPAAEVLRVPVAAHVTAVALTVQRAGFDDASVAAAFLHDVIEDANRFGQQLRYEELRALLGEEVADLVREVTEQKYDANGKPRSWRARKDDYIAHLLVGTARAAAISLADKLHNLWSINQALASGIDIFTPGDGHRALSAGPEDQLWFHEAVLNASIRHAEPQLAPLRERLREEIGRFEQLMKKAGKEPGMDPSGQKA